jgi:alkyl sulfatase BDS1-like metallo-beta-lactamase superfamily hydrolase
MNEGLRLDDILHSVRVPAHLADRPYLRPVYDDPEFVVRNIWRLYGGWWDGNPATLKPAPEAAVAREVADLAGGAARLAERARALASDGQLRLAGHLIEWARLAQPGEEAIETAYRDILTRRSEQEPSTMASSIFGDAADHPPD